MDTWVSFEIHPETPPGGMPYSDLFPGRDMAPVQEGLRRRAEELGLPFGRVERISNSRLAIEAAELARDEGLFAEFSRAVFRAYFADARDIGDAAVLGELGAGIGLPVGQLMAALEEGRYAGRRRETAAEAARQGFSGVPTFVFAGGEVMVGAQPLSAFRTLLDRLTRALD